MPGRDWERDRRRQARRDVAAADREATRPARDPRYDADQAALRALARKHRATSTFAAKIATSLHPISAKQAEVLRRIDRERPV